MASFERRLSLTPGRARASPVTCAQERAQCELADTGKGSQMVGEGLPAGGGGAEGKDGTSCKGLSRATAGSTSVGSDCAWGGGDGSGRVWAA